MDRIVRAQFGSCVLAIIFAMCAPIHAQTGPTGTWRVEYESMPPWEVVLRVNRSKLTGMVSQCAGRLTEISEGHVDGNRITFKCTRPDNVTTIEFTGTVNADEIAFTWDMRLRDGSLPPPVGNLVLGPLAPRHFIAKRVSDGLLAKRFDDAVRGVEFAAAVNLLQRDTKVDGTLFVPAKLKRVRAVIVVARWGLGDDFYQDAKVWKLLETTGSAVLLARFSDMGPTTILWRNQFNRDASEGLVILLQRFAQESGHRELSNVPVLFWGHSAAGFMAQVFADRNPDRVLAFVDYHAGLAGDAKGALTKIPGLLLAGGKDTASPASVVETTWKSGRAMRAPWTFAVEPDAAHGDLTEKGYALMVPWIEAVIRQRLPKDGTTLRAATDSSGWLGRQQNGEIAPYGTFAGSKTEASWLPDEASARGWQAVVGAAK